jgi:hypothetical protein
MRRSDRAIVASGLAIVAALLVVGVVSHGILRHLIQTLPVWISIVLALRGSPLARWTGLPVYAFWFLIVALIWLYLLGVARIANGHYSPTEVVMTVIVGAACVVGAVAAVGAGRSGRRAGAGRAALAATLVVGLQVGVFAVSIRPPISSDAAVMAWLRHQPMPPR